jgi:hypothetical protein
VAMLKAATKVITETNFRSPGVRCEQFYGSCSENWDTEIEKAQMTYSSIKIVHSRIDCAFQSRLQY